MREAELSPQTKPSAASKSSKFHGMSFCTAAAALVATDKAADIDKCITHINKHTTRTPRALCAK
jgi:hypothetical protein